VRAHWRWWVAAAGLAGVCGPGPTWAQGPVEAPSCEWCQAKLGSVEALRAQLPASWSFDPWVEPVYGSRTWVVQAGLQHRQAVLLVHGLGANGWTDWFSTLQALSERYRVVALDLPGFGYAQGVQGRLSPARLALVLRALLDHLALDAVTVVGHSMGGAVSLSLAAQYPRGISRLVLVDAAGILERTALLKAQALAQLPLDRVRLPPVAQKPLNLLSQWGQSKLEAAVGGPDPTRWLAEREWLWGLLGSGAPQVNAAVALSQEDFSEGLSALSLPVFMIWGELDPIAPLRTAKALQFVLPRSRLTVLPGVGHTPMEAASFEAFRAALQAALSEEWPALRAPPLDEAAGVAAPDLLCQGESGTRYSGVYRRIELRACTAIHLQQVRARELWLEDSIASAEDLWLGESSQPPEVALKLDRSSLVLTAAEVRGQTAVELSDARLDIAGVRLKGEVQGLSVQGASRLVASFSELRLGQQRRFLHFSEKLEKGSLKP
jgi:pimeloyl-ACP methyl ester carboxylesterase